MFDFHSPAPAETGTYDNSWKDAYTPLNAPIAKAIAIECIVLHVDSVIQPNREGVYRERLNIVLGTAKKNRFKITLYGNRYENGAAVENSYTFQYWAFMMLAGKAIGGDAINAQIREFKSQFDDYKHFNYMAFENKGMKICAVIADRGMYNNKYYYVARFYEAGTHLSMGEIQAGKTVPEEINEGIKAIQKNHDDSVQNAAGATVTARPYQTGANPYNGMGAQPAPAPAPAPAPETAGKQKGQSVAVDPLNDDIPF